jgi:TonB family protein
MKKSDRKFLKVPEYPGGKTAYKEYIKENLQYPEQALKQQVEGIVYLVAEINDNGEVEEVWIEKGLGYGCDEEAIRLIKNIHFGAVKNRGLRLKTKKRFRIEFKLPPQNKIHYEFKPKNKVEDETKNSKPGGYSYTIPIKK